MNRPALAACLLGLSALCVPAPAQVPRYTITTVAGGGTALPPGDGDGGLAINAVVGNPFDVAVDAAGNLYIADSARIRKVTFDGIVNTVAGGGSPADGVGDGGLATAARIESVALAVDSAGDIYISDAPLGTSRVRKVDASGTITTVAGSTGQGYSGDGGLATSAKLANVQGLAADAAGNLYIADTGNNRIRKVSRGGVITTIAGGGNPTYPSIGDGGLATSASLSGPYGVAVDSTGNIYIADEGHDRIRKVSTAGIITTVAGNGTATYSGDGGTATQAGIDSPWHVAVDAIGNIYITERLNTFAPSSGNYVRAVTPEGIITTVAGNGDNRLGGIYTGYAGDGGLATDAELRLPGGIAVNKSGLVYVAQLFSQRVRLLTPMFPAMPSVGAVTNGASFAAGSIVPGEIATLFGTNLTSASGINISSSLPLPSELVNVAVKVNGLPAPIFAVDNVNGQEQINFQAPWETANGTTATIEVDNGGAIGQSLVVPVIAAQPAIFNYVSGGNTFGAILHANYQVADAAHPVTPGETVLVYCNGLGVVSSPPADGAPASGQQTAATPTVTIGGMPAHVAFSGLAPGFAGLNQVNVAVPQDAPSGNQPVILTVNGAASPAVLLPVK